jgi:hypothetical protein
MIKVEFRLQNDLSPQLATTITGFSKSEVSLIHLSRRSPLSAIVLAVEILVVVFVECFALAGALLVLATEL